VTLDGQDEVGYYHLAQAHRALGDTAAEQKALSEFRRLRAEKARREQAAMTVSSSRDVTRQELDSERRP
jgi:hypothetical protein